MTFFFFFCCFCLEELLSLFLLSVLVEVVKNYLPLTLNEINEILRKKVGPQHILVSDNRVIFESFQSFDNIPTVLANAVHASYSPSTVDHEVFLCYGFYSCIHGLLVFILVISEDLSTEGLKYLTYTIRALGGQTALLSLNSYLDECRTVNHYDTSYSVMSEVESPPLKDYDYGLRLLEFYLLLESNFEKAIGILDVLMTCDNIPTVLANAVHAIFSFHC